MSDVQQECRLDRDPTIGATPEWLVISALADAAAASQAVLQARAQGMRVNHLTLAFVQDIAQVILEAAEGAKHIVVAEGGADQLADEVRRLLPQIGVVPANSATGPVPASLILERLLHTPRCC